MANLGNISFKSSSNEANECNNNSSTSKGWLATPRVMFSKFCKSVLRRSVPPLIEWMRKNKDEYITLERIYGGFEEIIVTHKKGERIAWDFIAEGGQVGLEIAFEDTSDSESDCDIDDITDEEDVGQRVHIRVDPRTAQLQSVRDSGRATLASKHSRRSTNLSSKLGGPDTHDNNSIRRRGRTNASKGTRRTETAVGAGTDMDTDTEADEMAVRNCGMSMGDGYGYHYGVEPRNNYGRRPASNSGHDTSGYSSNNSNAQVSAGLPPRKHSKHGKHRHSNKLTANATPAPAASGLALGMASSDTATDGNSDSDSDSNSDTDTESDGEETGGTTRKVGVAKQTAVSPELLCPVLRRQQLQQQKQQQQQQQDQDRDQDQPTSPMDTKPHCALCCRYCGPKQQQRRRPASESEALLSRQGSASSVGSYCQASSASASSADLAKSLAASQTSPVASLARPSHPGSARTLSPLNSGTPTPCLSSASLASAPSEGGLVRTSSRSVLPLCDPDVRAAAAAAVPRSHVFSGKKGGLVFDTRRTRCACGRSLRRQGKQQPPQQQPQPQSRRSQENQQEQPNSSRAEESLYQEAGNDTSAFSCFPRRSSNTRLPVCGLGVGRSQSVFFKSTLATLRSTWRGMVAPKEEDLLDEGFADGVMKAKATGSFKAKSKGRCIFTFRPIFDGESDAERIMLRLAVGGVVLKPGMARRTATV